MIESGRWSMECATMTANLRRMCTVSIIPYLRAAHHTGHASTSANGSVFLHRNTGASIGFRLVTNRDELRTRATALPPRWHELASEVVTVGTRNGEQTRNVRAVYPVDPAGGGTWIASAPSGLVLCILNANPIPPGVLPPSSALLSRGLIIPRLMSLAGVGQSSPKVLKLLGGFELDRFAPFRLIGVSMSDKPGQQGFVAIEASWNRAELTLKEHAPGPVCFVSSGLGDPLVKPRIKLFNETVRASLVSLPELAAAQDRFHHHVWEDRPEISVLMNRRDARTVSISTVEVAPPAQVGSGAVEPELTFEYEAVPEQAAAVPHDEVVKTHAQVHVPVRVARRMR